jgi:hypothetical protein
VESGGRLRCHLDRNLLMPGLGGGVVGAVGAVGAAEGDTRHGPDGISVARVALRGGGTASWRCRVEDDRTFEIEVETDGPVAHPAAFQLNFDPVGACPTVWSGGTDFPLARKRRKIKRTKMMPLTNTYSLPLLIHFPDSGFLRVEGEGAVICRETWRPDLRRVGLSLGLDNRGYHTGLHAYHHGVIEMEFVAPAAEPLRLRFTVEDEHVPMAETGIFAGKEWAGLRRCWHNAFTLDRGSLTMGDNILLGGIAHLAIHFKSEMALYTPSLLPGLSLHDFLKRALELAFGRCQGASGEINMRFDDREARKTREVSSFIDCTPSNLLALCNHLAATGDWSLFFRHRRAVRRAAAFLLDLESGDDGMLALPYHGNNFDETDRARTRNWWDNIAFGHHDACFMLLCHQALHRIEEVFALAGMERDAGRIRAWRRRFARNFHRVFFNPETRLYGGWVSLDGRLHDYAFTFVNAMAINEGLVPPRRARCILRDLLRRMQSLGYDGSYGVPGNLIPLAPADTIDWDVLGRWGVYENGGLCGMAAGHFLKALYQVGMRAEADQLLFRMLATFEREESHSGPFPGYGRSVDWRTKEGLPCGYNYLADNYYFMITAVVGHAGIPRPALIPPPE